MHATYVIRTSARKHSRIARSTRPRLVLLCTSLVFLKIPTCLYNSTMHSVRFLFLQYIQGEGYLCLPYYPPIKINWLTISFFPLLQSVIGQENSRYALYQSGAKLKPIACWPLMFFHASGSLLWYFLPSNWPVWFRLRALARLTSPERSDLNIKAIFAVINTTWTVVKIRPENNLDLYGIWCNALPTELTSQLGAGH